MSNITCTSQKMIIIMTKSFVPFPRKICSLTLALLMTGCASIGPRVLQQDRLHYNEIMRNTSNQELLFNMVRLRYNEAPMAIKVGNISGSTTWQKQAAFGTTLFSPSSKFGSPNSSTLGAQTLIVDNPIISYTPLDGSAYTLAFLRALDLSDINVLLQSSWSISRLFRLSLQSIGTAVNAPSAARPTSSHIPVYKDFLAVAAALRRIQVNDSLIVYYKNKGDHEELNLVIRHGYKLNAKEKALFKKTGIEIYHNKITLTNKPQPHKVYVITRSMLGVLNYLSKGMDVPPIDAQRKILTQTKYRNGKIFNWQEVVTGIMTIHYSDTRPQNAFLSVPYRGRWYYISDSDTSTKQTLILLSNLSGLVQEAPPSSTQAPGLTRVV